MTTDDDILAEYLTADTDDERQRLSVVLEGRGIDAAEVAFLAETLGSLPSWEMPSTELEGRIMADVMIEAGNAPPNTVRHSSYESSEPSEPSEPKASMPIGPTGTAPVVDLAARRAVRARRAPWVLGIAAALVVGAFVGRAGFDRQPGFDGRTTLAATGLAPGASGSIRFRAESAGVRIDLDAANLPTPGPGQFFEGWLSDGRVRVSIGSFSGSGRATLWSGVSIQSFNALTVTLEDTDGNPASSGRVVLRARLGDR